MQENNYTEKLITIAEDENPIFRDDIDEENVELETYHKVVAYGSPYPYIF